MRKLTTGCYKHVLNFLYIYRRYRMYANYLTFWRRNYFFFNFSTPVYKIWIILEPYTLELWNEIRFEEEKTESIYHV
jgi:hypothetical protein